MGRYLRVLGALLALLLASVTPQAQQSLPVALTLVPTRHPPLPRELSQLWLVPGGGPSSSSGSADFVAAVKLVTDGSFAKALPMLSQSKLRQGPLSDYADYFKGVSELRLGRAEEARRTFQSLRARNTIDYVTEAAAIGEAEAAESLGNHASSLDIYEALLKTKTAMPVDALLMRMGREAKAVGDTQKTILALSRVYYDFPLSEYSVFAGAELKLQRAQVDEPYARRLQRAEKIFSAKRYELARGEFESLRSGAEDDDRALVGLRIAECDYFLKRTRNAREALRPYLEHADRQAEVLYFHALISRTLGNADEYLASVRRVIDDYPTDLWAEDALNDLATYQARQDDDDESARLFGTLYERFPKGRYAERAAWKTGWWSYRNARYADTIRVFEKAAFDFPRSDYRPAWLYWSGRAYDAAKASSLAESRYRLATTDYLNSYYGRLAAQRLGDRGLPLPQGRIVTDGASAAALPANASTIRALLSLGLYDQAENELRYARAVLGESPVVEATVAWIASQQARSESGPKQFALYRGAINGMKRAYPQFIAAGGEDLPSDVLRVIFPMAYWDLIRKYATENNVDPYVAAALVAQESTFVPTIKSVANAVGLTQLLPSTARQYARTLKLRYSSRLLTNPEMNVRIGMTYLGDKVREFGELHLALASYNAGERAVHRWVDERAGLDRDEFIDDIPYAQTQNYVKKILGMAEDYRRLYGPDSSWTEPPPPPSVSPAKKSGRSTAKPASGKVTGKKKAHRAV